MPTTDSVIAQVYHKAEFKACPIDTAFKIIGKKWTVLVLREMLLGATQFNRLQERIDGITSKVLSQRLKELQHVGIVERRIVSRAPIRVEYRLTDLGRRLEPVLGAAAEFSMTSFPKAVFRDGKPRTPAEILESQTIHRFAR